MTHPTLTRRHTLQALAATASAGLLPAWAQAPQRRFEPAPAAWRRFEVSTEVQVPEVRGHTRLWLPVPDVEADYQRVEGHRWTGNAQRVQVVADAPRGVRMLMAEFTPDAGLPRLTLTSTLQTRSRAVNWQEKRRVSEDLALLRASLQPTALLPLDGVVRKTAQEATRGMHSDVDKVRAIYKWVLTHAHREPKTRGCGTGDIKAMLETGNLGGKCADLNAVFVGLCRASGVPARDVYGLRLAPSAFGYKELGAGSAKLQGAQHCRAEVYLAQHGWVAMDPADVLKVMRQETPEWIKDLAHPVVAPVMAGLFGGWEGNWVAWNTAHDVRLPGAKENTPLGFLMYPNGENELGRFDELSPDSFRYTIQARELSAA